MPRGGNNRKLPFIDALEGNPGHKSLAALEASGVEAGGQPFTAEHLMDDARGCIEIIRQCMPRQVYSTLDSFQLAAFGMAWALHKLAATEIAKSGFQAVYTNDKGNLVENPWANFLNKQAMVMLAAGDRLGLDPRSRASIKLPNAKKKSKFAGLIGQNASSSSLNG